MDLSRKATWAAGCEQPASPPPDHSQRLDDSEVQTDTREQEIIYMELSRQSHTASRARAIYPPSSARLQRTPRRRRSASAYSEGQPPLPSPPLPTSPGGGPHTAGRVGKATWPAGREQFTSVVPRLLVRETTANAERRATCTWAADRNRMTGSWEEGVGP